MKSGQLNSFPLVWVDAHALLLDVQMRGHHVEQNKHDLGWEINFDGLGNKKQ